MDKDKLIKKLNKNKPYKPLPDYLSIGPSDIHGTGVFALDPIPSNSAVDYLVTGLNAGGLLGGNRTLLGKYINHQSSPNGRMEKIPSTADKYYFKSLSDIDGGTELTID